MNTEPSYNDDARDFLNGFAAPEPDPQPDGVRRIDEIPITVNGGRHVDAGYTAVYTGVPIVAADTRANADAIDELRGGVIQNQTEIDALRARIEFLQFQIQQLLDEHSRAMEAM